MTRGRLAASIGACALTLAACTGQIDERDQPGQQAPIIGGKETSARSEIGLLEHLLGDGGGAYCTATLISPRAAVTAAHCLGYGSSEDARGESLRLYLFGADVTNAYDVARYRSYGSARVGPDLALVLLETAVPREIAVPAVLASAKPPPGEPVRLFGFGCTDRAPPKPDDPDLNGFGVKRVATLGYGEVSASVCPGDSGGPLMRDGALVLSIVSGYRTQASAAGPAGSDVLVDLVSRRAALLAQLDAWGAPVDPAPCNGAAPGVHRYADAVNGLCVAATYYCNDRPDGSPLEQPLPDGFATDDRLAVGCGYHGWSRQDGHTFMWQQNACRPCVDCARECA